MTYAFFLFFKEEIQTCSLWVKSKMCLDLDLALKQKYKSLSKTDKISIEWHFLLVNQATWAFEKFATGTFIFGQNDSSLCPLNSLTNILSTIPGETAPKAGSSSQVLLCFPLVFITCRPAAPAPC